MQAQKAQRLISSIWGRSLIRRKYHQGDYQHTTYNELPTPQGSWQTHHDAQQRKYNAHLLFGIAFAVGTVLVAKATGCLELNYYPPAKPAAKNEY